MIIILEHYILVLGTVFIGVILFLLKESPVDKLIKQYLELTEKKIKDPRSDDLFSLFKEAYNQYKLEKYYEIEELLRERGEDIDPSKIAKMIGALKAKEFVYFVEKSGLKLTGEINIIIRKLSINKFTDYFNRLNRLKNHEAYYIKITVLMLAFPLIILLVQEITFFKDYISDSQLNFFCNIFIFFFIILWIPFTLYFLTEFIRLREIKREGDLNNDIN